jgi:hypothetical protein
MDPNDPTRIQPVAGPGPEPPVAWPHPPGPSAPPGSYQAPPGAPPTAPPTATYPAASPPAPPYLPPAGGSFDGGPLRPPGPSRGLLITGSVIALLLAGVIGFIVGVQVEKGRKPSSVAASTSAPTTVPATSTPATGKKAGKAAKAAAGTGGRSTTGQVGAVSGSGFTISLPDGTSVNVVVSGKTKMVKKMPASLQDVTPGSSVVVVGPRGPNGDITARMVTIG